MCALLYFPHLCATDIYRYIGVISSFSFDLFKVKRRWMLILVPPLNLITVILLGEIGVMTVERLTPSVGRMLSDKNLCESDGTGSLPSLQGTFFLFFLSA